jgi:hypothetical protein
LACGKGNSGKLISVYQQKNIENKVGLILRGDRILGKKIYGRLGITFTKERKLS